MEQLLLCKTVRDMMWSRLTNADKEVVKKLVATHFGEEPPLGPKLEPGRGWPGSAEMMSLTMQVRHGGLFVNVKDADVDACLSAVKEEATKAGAELVRVSGTMAEMSVDAFGGQDGVFTQALRAASENSWLAVVCGDIGDSAVEKMECLNTVLDDNKVLCTAAGERISLKGRVIFVSDATDKFSPATISRLGVVYAD